MAKSSPWAANEVQYQGDSPSQMEPAAGVPVSRSPGFRLLLGALFTADTANYSIVFAAMAWIEEMTHSSTQMAWMLLSSTLPGLLYGLIAGVVVDRRDRRNVLLAGNAVRLLTAGCFVLALRIKSPAQSLIAIYLCCFVLSAAVKFIDPAQSAITSQLVGGGKALLSANSLRAVLALATQGLGQVILTPLLLNAAGPGAVGIMSVLLYGAAIRLVSRLPREAAPATANGERSLSSVWADLREGWRLIIHDRPLTEATVELTVVSAAVMWLSMLAPGLASRAYGVRVSDIAYMLVPVGVGFGLGLVLLSKWAQRFSNARWIRAGLISFGLSLAVLPLGQGWGWRAWPLLVLAAVGLGLGFALASVPAKTVLQERPPAGMRGRVLATQGTLSSIATSLPLPLAGLLADSVGVSRMVALLAVCILGVGIVGKRYVAG